MRKKCQYLAMISLLFPFGIRAQNPEAVCFVNSGKMYVAPRPSGVNDVSLYVPNAVLMTGFSDIKQEGITVLGSNFYQGSETHVFDTDVNGKGTSMGKVVFSGNTNTRRYVTHPTAISTFDRSTGYVAFPNLEIATSDSIFIPGKMGIDATKILSSSTGKLYLESTIYGVQVYDASLRLTGTGTSSELAPAGSVIIERDVSLYRNTIPNSLAAYATPFLNTQISGYFAGNWIRKLIPNASTGHVQYYYGNESSGGIIKKEQYLYNPLEKFIPGNGYLLKMQPFGYDYMNGPTGAILTSGGNPTDYDRSMLIFDGSPYRLPGYNEQIFAEPTLSEHSINATPGATVNWIFGNSYTSAISLAEVVKAIQASPLYIYTTLFVLPGGSTAYQPYSINNTLQVVDNLTDIPSMSIFMLRLDGSQLQNGTFSLNKNMQVHGSVAHNLRSQSAYNNEILFRISPVNTPQIYDLAAIGVRQGASEGKDSQDLEKMSLGNNEIFQLYTIDKDGNKLSANAIPESTKKVSLYLVPGATGGEFLLSASRLESITREGVWLEDKLKKETVDLMKSGEYQFFANPADNPNRFVVYFENPLNTPTGINEIMDNTVSIYYSMGAIVIKGLDQSDLGSKIGITDMQGRLLYSSSIKQAPEQYFNAPLADGIYIVNLKGNKNITIKLKKYGTN